MKDRFSNIATDYSTFRPTYPWELFDHILYYTRGREHAWDVATGNGQVAKKLARVFEMVSATDISSRQLQEAPKLDNVGYLETPAEETPFPDDCFDLITVAQAVHWFNIERFHREVQRTAREGAIVAEWGYGLLYTEFPEVNDHIEKFYSEVVGQYWDAERSHIDNAYKDLPFPFFPLPAPEFNIELDLDPEKLQGYLRTWSSVEKYIQENSKDPVSPLMEDLKGLIPSTSFKAHFPVFLRMGSVEK